MSEKNQLDMHPTSPSEDMHKLIGITLVNWYLFGAETIPFEGDSLLIRGANGVGKSSVLDAIQTVFAGGDENQLAMNAASSDGKKSGRTIRSYVLGEVAESPGLKACEPREVSNCYICLSFKNRLGKLFTIGIGLYARAKDSKSLQKYPFILDGCALTAQDFIKDERTILTWRGFEQKALTMSGRLILPQTAREYRQQYCEFLSAPGASNFIAPDMMFRALKNGLTFKEQKDISEFTRQYILPENNIDVLRIENDYKEYRRIQETIKDARERLESLTKIIDLLKRHRQKYELSLAYQWSGYEAKVQALDESIEANENRKEKLEKQLQNDEKQLALVQEQLPDLKVKRDDALFSHKNSAGQQALELCVKAIKQEEVTRDGQLSSIRFARSLLATLEQIRIPGTATPQLTTDFSAAREELKQATGFGEEDLSRQWPVDINNIDKTIEALQAYDKLSSNISSMRDTLLAERDDIAKRHTAIESALKNSSSGKSSLMPQTEEMITILKQRGIEALPVCDLAKITDDGWQMGIERFLGGNREALVIMNANETINEHDAFDEAVRIYRQAKNESAHLRSVKLINPDKLFSEDKPKPGYAGYLLESDNPVALRYLRGLLRNVKLVASEEELRREKRAITKDGMVAGNGSISGGNRFKWVLIGADARKRHAQKLFDELEALKPLFDRQQKDFHAINDINKVFSGDIARTMEACVEARTAQVTLMKSLDQLEQLARQQKQLNEQADDALEGAYILADAAWEDAKASETQIKLSKQKVANDLHGITELLPKLNSQIEQASQYRNSVSNEDAFNPEKASQLFEELESSLGEGAYQLITSESEKRHESNRRLSESFREDGKIAIVKFAELYDIEDKDELVVMQPIEALARCEEHAQRIEQAEIIGYEDEAQEAQEAMLSNFRSEVVAKLKECFSNIDTTFRTLNRVLGDLTFNGNRYRFVYPLKDVPTLRQVHEYVIDTSDLENQSVGDLFDSSKEHPAVKIIQDILVDGRLSEIADYRNFYSYDIISKNVDTETERKFSELLSVGSGGEKQAPFYVALGAAFMSAYKLRRSGKRVFGGVALAIFDEAFSKMDGNNAKAALQFFRDIGLQVILAAPPESEIKVGPYVDKSLSIIRPGDSIYLDYKTYHEKGRAILESDNPHVNPNIVSDYIEGVKEEMLVE